MEAHELADITQQAIEKRNKARPGKLFDEIFSKMRSQAEACQYHLDYSPTDEPEIMDVVVQLLKEKGYEVSELNHSVIRISWPKPTTKKATRAKPVETGCMFDIAWVGRCKKEADETGFCAEHKLEKCRCGRQGVRSCDATIGPLVCGAITCGRCTHHH